MLEIVLPSRANDCEALNTLALVLTDCFDVKTSVSLSQLPVGQETWMNSVLSIHYPAWKFFGGMFNNRF